MNLKEFFWNEVKPAFGCTETGAIALAASTASCKLDRGWDKVHLRLSGSIFKNGNSVGVPGTNGGTGNLLAAALGAVAGDPEKGLQSLEGVTAEDVKRAEEKVQEGAITQEVLKDVSTVYVEVQVVGEGGRASTTISGRHESIVEVTYNDEVIYRAEPLRETSDRDAPDYIHDLKQLDMESLWELASEIDNETVEYLLEGAEMNKAIAAEGMKRVWASGVGYHVNKIAPPGDLLYSIKAHTGGAADARMGGAPFAVMSSAGSGNHGITAILPPTLVAENEGSTGRELAEALALSHLITRYIKAYTGLLSPICGCAIAAGSGATAAIVKLKGGSPKQGEVAVANTVASLMGMICDGGKGSCAFKVSTAGAEAYIGAMLALRGGGVTEIQGLLEPDLKKIAEVLGEVSERGLDNMDELIIELIQKHSSLKTG